MKNKNEYAPIVVFAFNRLGVLKTTIESLKKNPEASNSDLFIFVDGARENKVGEAEKVKAVQDYVLSITGFKSVRKQFSNYNKGLANSIIEGVTEIINKFDRIIVVEDDLYVSKSFLRFMNEMLDKYNYDERIMQISGYGCLLTKVRNYPYDAYINERAHSWSWATWKDRWDSVDWEVSDFSQLLSSPKLQRKFNKRGSDLFGMLKGYMEHKNNSWFIRFNYSMYKQHRYSIMPINSLVRNDGFGLEATNCAGWNMYRINFEEEHIGLFNVPEMFEPCERIISNSVRYWSIPYRIYRKLRSLFYK